MPEEENLEGLGKDQVWVERVLKLYRQIKESRSEG